MLDERRSAPPSRGVRVFAFLVGLAALAGCGDDSRARLVLASAPRSITVYLHHIGWGGYYWRFKGVPGYDYAAEMARRGHVSLVYDQLGYGASGRPPGTESCHGGEADMLSQIVARLRSGDYAADAPSFEDGVAELPVVFHVQNTNRSRLPCNTDGSAYEIHGAIVGPASSIDGATPKFARVALASHGVGALATGPAAYSFGDLDALIVTSWASDTASFSLLFGREATALGLFCLMGGEPSEGTSGPGGYNHTPLSEEGFRALFFFDAEPAVVDGAVALRHRGPCGEPLSTTTGIVTDRAFLRTIEVPVLVVFGRNDALYRDPRSAGEVEAGLFTGSSDLTLAFLDATGSALALERSAPQFRELMSSWLAERGF